MISPINTTIVLVCSHLVFLCIFFQHTILCSLINISSQIFFSCYYTGFRIILNIAHYSVEVLEFIKLILLLDILVWFLIFHQYNITYLPQILFSLDKVPEIKLNKSQTLKKLCNRSEFKYVHKFFDMISFQKWRLILLSLSEDWTK